MVFGGFFISGARNAAVAVDTPSQPDIATATYENASLSVGNETRGIYVSPDGIHMFISRDRGGGPSITDLIYYYQLATPHTLAGGYAAGRFLIDTGKGGGSSTYNLNAVEFNGDGTELHWVNRDTTAPGHINKYTMPGAPYTFTGDATLTGVITYDLEISGVYSITIPCGIAWIDGYNLLIASDTGSTTDPDLFHFQFPGGGSAYDISQVQSVTPTGYQIRQNILVPVGISSRIRNIRLSNNNTFLFVALDNGIVVQLQMTTPGDLTTLQYYSSKDMSSTFGSQPLYGVSVPPIVDKNSPILTSVGGSADRAYEFKFNP